MPRSKYNPGQIAITSSSVCALPPLLQRDNSMVARVHIATETNDGNHRGKPVYRYLQRSSPERVRSLLSGEALDFLMLIVFLEYCRLLQSEKLSGHSSVLSSRHFVVYFERHCCISNVRIDKENERKPECSEPLSW